MAIRAIPERIVPIDLHNYRPPGVSPFRSADLEDEILRLSGMGRGLTEIAALLKCTYSEILAVLDAR